MSGVYFCEMLIAHTHADCDQQHLNFLLSSRADTPDRTDFILDHSKENPLPVMVREAKRLEACGAELLAIPCNTAHYFYDGICESVTIPVINIIEQTAAFCHSLGMHKVGVLATRGTISSGAYRTALAAENIEYVTCSHEDQQIISDLIYTRIKRGLPPDLNAFSSVCDRLRRSGCERIILGCTELSLLGRLLPDRERYLDSLEVLALSAIRLCGKEAVGFSRELLNFIPTKGKSPCC